MLEHQEKNPNLTTIGVVDGSILNVFQALKKLVGNWQLTLKNNLVKGKKLMPETHFFIRNFYIISTQSFLIEKFMLYTINYIKVYNLVIFSIFTILYKHQL